MNTHIQRWREPKSICDVNINVECMSDFLSPVLLLCEKYKTFDYINLHDRIYILAFLQLPLAAQLIKNLPTMKETWVWSLGGEDTLEKAMAPHSSTLAWKVPWTEEPDRLQSMGSPRVGHDWGTSLSLFTFSPILTLKESNVRQKWTLGMLNDSRMQVLQERKA